MTVVASSIDAMRDALVVRGWPEQLALYAMREGGPGHVEIDDDGNAAFVTERKYRYVLNVPAPRSGWWRAVAAAAVGIALAQVLMFLLRWWFQ